MKRKVHHKIGTVARLGINYVRRNLATVSYGSQRISFLMIEIIPPTMGSKICNREINPWLSVFFLFLELFL